MKTTVQKIKGIIASSLVLFICTYALPGAAQQLYSSSTTQTVLKGTSTLHDWDMKSTAGNTQATFKIENGEIVAITALNFTLSAETLKSGKSGLDKNAYKALKTGENPTITYKMNSGSVTKSGSVYVIKTEGAFTISGTTKPLSLTTTATLNSDQSISAKGVAKFNMSAYGVTPPTVMMGTIKTGDAVTIDYSARLSK